MDDISMISQVIPIYDRKLDLPKKFKLVEAQTPPATPAPPTPSGSGSGVLQLANSARKYIGDLIRNWRAGSAATGGAAAPAAAAPTGSTAGAVGRRAGIFARQFGKQIGEFLMAQAANLMIGTGTALLIYAGSTGAEQAARDNGWTEAEAEDLKIKISTALSSFATGVGWGTANPFAIGGAIVGQAGVDYDLYKSIYDAKQDAKQSKQDTIDIAKSNSNIRGQINLIRGQIKQIDDQIKATGLPENDPQLIPLHQQKMQLIMKARELRRGFNATNSYIDTGDSNAAVIAEEQKAWGLPQVTIPTNPVPARAASSDVQFVHTAMPVVETNSKFKKVNPISLV